MNGLGHVPGEWQARIRSEALDFYARQENFVTHELLPLLKNILSLLGVDIIIYL